jgi:hypothetical protein
MDVQEESSASDGAQTYEGWSEKIPPKGTPVLLVLSEAKESAGVEKSGDDKPDDQPKKP